MKIIFDKNGWLSIEKGGKVMEQYCPFGGATSDPPRCGLWCPMCQPGVDLPGCPATTVKLCKGNISGTVTFNILGS